MVWSKKKLDLTCLTSSKVWWGTHRKNPTVATIVQRQMCHKHRLSLLGEGGVQVPREEDSPGSSVHVRMNCYKIKQQNLPLQNQFMSDQRWNAKTNANVQKGWATEPEHSGDAQGSFTQATCPTSFTAQTQPPDADSAGKCKYLADEKAKNICKLQRQKTLLSPLITYRCIFPYLVCKHSKPALHFLLNYDAHRRELKWDDTVHWKWSFQKHLR